MTAKRVKSRIRHILCPTDLTPKSQKALGFAAQMAEKFDAQLTACHCAPAAWFSPVNRLSVDDVSRITATMNGQMGNCREEGESRCRTLVIENSFDPARDILGVVKETGVDLVVMKARRGILSALHFGSIVERIVDGCESPILLFPSSFLERRDPGTYALAFRNILFDYNFSFDTDRLFEVVNTLTQHYIAQLHVLSVLEPLVSQPIEVSATEGSPVRLKEAVLEKLNGAIRNQEGSSAFAPPVVEWGAHAETVLGYAREHDIDLICTTLSRPNAYREKLYRAYLGDLLKSASCPILVKQSV